MKSYLIILLIMWPLSGYASDFMNCGSLANAYGPFDYTNAQHRRDKLPVVERAHFDMGVATLQGNLTKPHALGDDLDYTLRAFPNHHRALYAMAMYHVKDYHHKKKAMRYSAECYFSRAKQLKPNDSKVWMIHGLYAHKSNRYSEAADYYQRSLELDAESAETHYNFALLLIEKKKFEEARGHARQAYQLGHTLPGLKNKLSRIGFPLDADQ